MMVADHGEEYGVVSCYNSLKVRGGAHSLVRLNLKRAVDRHLGGLFSVDVWYDSLKSAGFKVVTVDYEDPASGDDIPVLVCTSV